ncbi:MAG: hypothetical protein KGY80_06120 [Candidatus Thorarchaeota archaeon]|nr:hypothetical protein [Candidatus Thorarchaeota archaeon]
MKTYSELMLDLAYSSILFSSPGLTKWVMELEEEVDHLGYQLVMSLSLSIRDKEDAELAVGLFRVAGSTNRISDAAADIANLAHRTPDVHPIIEHVFKYVDERLMQTVISKNSELIGSNIGALWEKHDVNVDIIAVRRDNSWEVNPGKNLSFEDGDVIFLRGSPKEIAQFTELASNTRPGTDIEKSEEPEVSFERLLLDMKETSEFMVSMAFAAIKYRDSELAKEVRELEERIDNQCEIAIREIIANTGQNVNRKLDLMRFVIATEEIADAAWEIAAVQLSGLKTHPVIVSIADEAEEIVSRVTVHPESSLAGHSLRELALDDNYGIYVLSVRREGHWFHRPSADLTLRGGDVLVFDGYKSGLEEIREIADPTYSSE